MTKIEKQIVNSISSKGYVKINVTTLNYKVANFIESKQFDRYFDENGLLVVSFKK